MWWGRVGRERAEARGWVRAKRVFDGGGMGSSIVG